MTPLDPDAYLARIGLAEPASPTLDTLRALHRLHPEAIAFENLDPLMGKPAILDLPALADKLIAQGRGGYCYEQNTLFQMALAALGFRVTSHAARVQWHVLPGTVPPRYHMLLCVALPDGNFIADVGFGRLTLTAPLRLEHDIEQETPHGTYRLVAAGNEHQLQAKLGGAWEPIYQFSLQEEAPSDWVVANWYTSTHPDSVFTKNLMAARPSGDRLYGLFNSDLSVYHRDGRTERRTLANANELAAVLQEEFAIRLPADVAPALARLFAGR